MDYIDALIEAESSMEIEMWVAEERDYHAGNWRLYHRPEDYKDFSNWETYMVWRLLAWLKQDGRFPFYEHFAVNAITLQFNVRNLIEHGARNGFFPKWVDFINLVYAFGGCDFEELQPIAEELLAGDGR